MNLKNELLLKLFKLGTSDTLLSLWTKEHPNRYSEDETGLESWKRDLSHFGINDEESFSKILNNKIDENLINKFSNWADFISIFPEGQSVKDAWQEKSPSKSFDSFLRWSSSSSLEDLGSLRENIKNISIKKQEVRMPTESTKIPLEDENKQSSEVSGDDSFYKEILTALGLPVSHNNLTFFYAWRQAEGGKASYNPFNTTLKMDGATNYNKVGVKNYPSREAGISAIVKTLQNPRYQSIIDSMKLDKEPIDTANELVASPWGTSSLILKVLQGYSHNKPKPPPIGTL